MKNMIKTIALCGMLIAPAMNAAGSDYSYIGSKFATLILTKNNKYAVLAATIALVTPLTIWAIYKYGSKKADSVSFGEVTGFGKATPQQIASQIQ